MTQQEILDIVDESDTVIGSATRETIHAESLIHRVAFLFVVNRKSELLIQRRSNTKESNPGLYDVSVAEHVLKDESYEDAAIRGAQEELGVKPRTMRYIADYYSDSRREKRRLFVCSLEGPFTPCPAEVAELKFMTIEQVKAALQVQPFTQGFIKSFEIYYENVYSKESITRALI